MISCEWMADMRTGSSLYHQLAHLSCKKNGNFLHSIPSGWKLEAKCVKVFHYSHLARSLFDSPRAGSLSIRTLCTHEIQEVRMRFYAVARLKRPQCCWLVSFRSTPLVFFRRSYIYIPLKIHMATLKMNVES